jgi:hypothetical protein
MMKKDAIAKAKKFFMDSSAEIAQFLYNRDYFVPHY